MTNKIVKCIYEFILHLNILIMVSYLDVFTSEDNVSFEVSILAANINSNTHSRFDMRINQLKSAFMYFDQKWYVYFRISLLQRNRIQIPGKYANLIIIKCEKNLRCHY